jgi:toxin ParE1/3/4
MSARYTLAPRAQADLEEIWQYTAKCWTIEQAETYIRQLANHFASVAERPEIGMRCQEIRPGYYKFPAGSHVLFYQITDGGINIVRILHERMDAARHLRA